MKKLVKYMQNQAVEYSGQQKSTVYLAPPGEEPQQRGQRSPHHHQYVRNGTRGGGAARGRINASLLAALPKDIIKHQYAADNISQYYEAYVPQATPTTSESSSSPPSSAKYWVIFIHGGYYRDTTVQASSFHPALASLLSNPLYLHVRRAIAGYASINYRLSPNPKSPQYPDKTPAYEMHDAKHPDHIIDVLAGIAELQRKYGFGSNYLLAGHSVGATLAFQVALCQQREWEAPSPSSSSSPPSVTAGAASPSPSTSSTNPPIAAPSGILGVNGIYSFPALHESFPSYVDMTAGAFGSDAAVYAAVSPASYSAATYAKRWRPSHGRPRIVILASSPQDRLVDQRQVDVMIEALTDDGRTAPAATPAVQDGVEGEGEDFFEEGNASTSWEDSISSSRDPTRRQMSTATAFSDATTINPATASNSLFTVKGTPEGFDVQTLQLKGDHDYVWQSGDLLARAIALVVGQMKRAERDELR